MSEVCVLESLRHTESHLLCRRFQQPDGGESVPVRVLPILSGEKRLGCFRRCPPVRVHNTITAWSRDSRGRERREFESGVGERSTPPFYSQYIAYRGGCGKTRVVPHSCPL